MPHTQEAKKEEIPPLEYQDVFVPFVFITKKRYGTLIEKDID